MYDIISWDPRGVGNLTVSVQPSCVLMRFVSRFSLSKYLSPGEVYCFHSAAERAAFFNGTIELTGILETGNFTDPDDVSTFLAQAPIMQQKYEELGKKCLDSPGGKYLQYLGTPATVRDMVSLANAIEGPDALINYYGISGGTIIGDWFVNSE